MLFLEYNSFVNVQSCIMNNFAPSTYFSMENYKADANLMIGDMMVTMTDDGDDDDVFISMLETRKRFWEMRIA